MLSVRVFNYHAAFGDIVHLLTAICDLFQHIKFGQNARGRNLRSHILHLAFVVCDTRKVPPSSFVVSYKYRQYNHFADLCFQFDDDCVTTSQDQHLVAQFAFPSFRQCHPRPKESFNLRMQHEVSYILRLI